MPGSTGRQSVEGTTFLATETATVDPALWTASTTPLRMGTVRKTIPVSVLMKARQRWNLPGHLRGSTCTCCRPQSQANLWSCAACRRGGGLHLGNLKRKGGGPRLSPKGRDFGCHGTSKDPARKFRRLSNTYER